MGVCTVQGNFHLYKTAVGTPAHQFVLVEASRHNNAYRCSFHHLSCRYFTLTTGTAAHSDDFSPWPGDIIKRIGRTKWCTWNGTIWVKTYYLMSTDSGCISIYIFHRCALFMERSWIHGWMDVRSKLFAIKIGTHSLINFTLIRFTSINVKTHALIKIRKFRDLPATWVWLNWVTQWVALGASSGSSSR